jgi:hypothetical protein
MRTLILILFAGLIACNQPQPPAEAPPEQTAQVEAPAVAESGEALGVAPEIPLMKVNVAWVLSTGFEAKTKHGITQIKTAAWQAVPAGQTYDPSILMRDLIGALTKAGTLTGVDLTKPAKDYLLIFYPGSTPRPDFVLDSRNLRAVPK